MRTDGDEKYSGTSLKRTSSKADTSLRRTKILVPDEFLRNPYNKTFPKRTLQSGHLLKADTLSRSRTTISPRIYLYKAKKYFDQRIKNSLFYCCYFSFSSRHLFTTHSCSLNIKLTFFDT